MGEMKSAYEKAMEKIEKLGKPSPEEIGELEYVPKGNLIAARYLKGEDIELVEGINRFEQKVRKYIHRGVEEILLENIALPQKEAQALANKRAIEGLVSLKKDKKNNQALLEQLRMVFNYYEKAKQQVAQQVRQAVEMKLSEAMKAMEQQSGMKLRIDVESQPEYKEGLFKAMAQLNQQYEKALKDWREHIKMLK